MLTYRGKEIRHVGFIGFGESNRGVFEYLTRSYPRLEYTVRSRVRADDTPPECRCLFGECELSGLDEDLIFLSPTVKRNRCELCNSGISERLTSDARFFYDNTRSVCYAVTGSDGKSTTSVMTEELLTRSGIDAEAIGNIGKAMTPMLDYPTRRFVTELSSFQLMDFEPPARRAAILNVTPNHLDFHSSYEEYRRAKENAVRSARESIFSLDSEDLIPIIEKRRAFALFSSHLSAREMLRYPAELYYYTEGGYICRSGERIIPLSELRRREEHYVRNFLAALALTDGDVTEDAIADVASSFTGLKHRCELVYTGAGVDYYDSSVDSTPERTKTTLRGFLRPHVLILGGRSKGLDFGILSEAIGKLTRYVIITGENRAEIFAALYEHRDKILVEEDFKRAVELSAELGQAVGAVLLSPASTSFDRFKNYRERAEVFLSTVRSL